MNIVTCQYPPCSKPIPPLPGPGKPKKFCSNACKTAHARDSKKPPTPISPNLSKAILSLSSLKPSTPPTFTSKLHAYLPTQNDANILAILLQKPLPYPNHNAVPISLLSTTSPLPSPPPIQTFDDQPTF